MLPTKNEFPEFVPDQLLTSDDLNTLFGHLDEQGRLTRTNLIGIGVLCGLKVQTRADGTGITVTQGVGVTSEGYLVSIEGDEYTRYAEYDPTVEHRYGPFATSEGHARLPRRRLCRQAGRRRRPALSRRDRGEIVEAAGARAA